MRRSISQDLPTDGITQLSFVNHNEKRLLACTSWDGHLRVYEINDTEKLAVNVDVAAGPLLSLACTNDILYVGSATGSVHALELSTNNLQRLEVRHDKAVSCLSVVGSQVVSACWDGQCKVYNTNSKEITLMTLPGKALDMDSIDETRVVVACTGRQMLIIDVATATIVHAWESLLKFQARCVRAIDDVRIVTASIEGRVAVEQPLNANSKGFAFKCHRQDDKVYPVNALAVHKFGTFCTGGCDGTIVSWDGNAKKKLSTLEKVPTSVASLALSDNLLAVASSYTFEDGEQQNHPPDEIFLYELTDEQVQPKGN